VGGLLEGRTALVVGVLNKRSIATAIATALAGAGARLALTYQNERTHRDVSRVADGLPGDVPLFPLDVADDDQCDAAVAGAVEALGGIDVLVHAVAFAKAEDLEGRFADTSRDGFLLAQEISAYSLVALARRVEPSMLARGGGSIMTLSYLGAERAVPGYDVMGVAKASLEASVRYLAWDLGPGGIRVNAISPGPIRTAAARGIPGFQEMADAVSERTPMRRETTAEQVGGAALYLASDLGSNVTGETLHVDAGYHAMGL
jgi:enoyl-[acyl-carrier protein] reductase I